MQRPIFVILFVSLFFYRSVFAAAQFSARVDQNQISLQDDVALKLVTSFDSNGSANEPQYSAPDFKVINEFNSVSVQYDSVHGMQKSQEITVVLRPLKAGKLLISNIQIKADDKIYTADNIQINVSASAPKRNNVATPRGGAGGGFGPGGLFSALGLGGNSGRIRLAPGGPNNPAPNGPNQGQPAEERKTKAFVRAEIERSTVYKGEQIIVSYYLYHQMKVFNLQVEKFPILNGFLREDLEMPIMGQSLESEAVTLKGEPFQRSLLARYAAYPLQEGKLDIDSMTLKFNYYAGNRNSPMDDEDPFFSFFQQVAPRTAGTESEHLAIQVQPLPEAGRSANFVGGVGDFTVTSAVNKYEVKANEAISFNLKVEGRGNVANIQEPKRAWPSGIELYETKGKSQTGRGGVGQKVFEFLLIPRSPGKVILPAIDLEFFDPGQKRYYTKSTEPIELNILDPAPGSAPLVASSTQSAAQSNVQQTAPVGIATPPADRQVGGTSNVRGNPDEPRSLKPILTHPELESGQSFIWRILYIACVGCFGLLVVLVVHDFFKKKRSSRSPKPKWDVLHQVSRKATTGAAWKEVTEAYETLTDVILDAIDQEYQIGARSFSRNELKAVLHDERGLPTQIWQRLVALLEFTELVRFASSIGAVSESEARTKLAHWVAEGEVIVKNILLKKGS